MEKVRRTVRDLIIFSGQSNMEGETERLPDDNSAVEGAWEYRFLTDSLVPLRHPVGEFIAADGTPLAEGGRSALLGSYLGNANMVPSFCRAYVRTAGREAVAVHAAKGPTTIADWLPEGENGAMLLRKAKAAAAKVRPERILFVWLQGESDQLAGHSRAYYKAHLLALRDALRRELGIDLFGVIRVGRFTGTQKDDGIIEAQREVCREREDFCMLTEAADELWAQPRFMNPASPGHYSCAGQERIGTLAGTALGEWVRKNRK